MELKAPKLFVILVVLGAFSSCLHQESMTHIKSISSGNECVVLNPDRLQQDKVCQADNQFVFYLGGRTYQYDKRNYLSHLFNFLSVEFEFSTKPQKILDIWTKKVDRVDLIVARSLRSESVFLLVSMVLKNKERITVKLPLFPESWKLGSSDILTDSTSSRKIPYYLGKKQVQLSGPLPENFWRELIPFFPKLSLSQVDNNSAVLSFNPFTGKQEFEIFLKHPKIKDRLVDTVAVSFKMPIAYRARFYSNRF